MNKNFLSKYYVAFPSGVEKVVGEIIKSKDNSAQIEKQLDGGVVFSSKQPSQSFANLPFANNSFLVLDQLHIKENAENSLAKAIRSINESLQRGKITLPKLQGKRFRVISSYQNTLSKLPPSDHRQMELLLTKKTRGHVDRMTPDYEFWILQRSEGVILFMLRLSKNPNQRNTIQKGELSPQIAYAMCRMADLKKEDSVVDPFVGYGGIPKVLQRYFQPEKMFLSDIDKKLVQDLKLHFDKTNNIEIYQSDARKLNNLKSESIDKIITDPPWGIFEKIDNMEEFYENFLTEFYRIVKKGGKVILLTAKKELLEDILNNKFKAKFTLENTYHILVSGKKSAIYVLKKE